MIVTRTPLRISFAGGGSDLPQFFETQRGAVLSAAIDKYMYVAVNDKFDGGVRVSYSVTENVAHVGELHHDIARETLKCFGITHGIEIVSIADVPAGTGLGSSSAYAVGLYAALLAQTRGGKIESLWIQSIAMEAANIEIHNCGRNVGLQDAFAAAYGDVRHYEFDGPVPTVHAPIPASNLHAHLLLFYLGGARDAHAQINAMVGADGWQERTARLVYCADEMRWALENEHLPYFGKLLDEAWNIKRAWASNPRIDAVYDTAKRAGAWGGKLCGAGGGGFLLVCAPPEKRDELRAALDLREIPFRFEQRGVEVMRV